MVFTDWDTGDLALRDMSSGKVKRLLVQPGSSDNYGYLWRIARAFPGFPAGRLSMGNGRREDVASSVADHAQRARQQGAGPDR